jgi:hypothetical protein
MIVRIDADAAQAAEDPVFGQILGPSRIHLITRGLGEEYQGKNAEGQEQFFGHILNPHVPFGEVYTVGAMIS